MNWELAFSVKGQSANTLDSEGHVVSGQLLSSAMIICKGMGQVDSVKSSKQEVANATDYRSLRAASEETDAGEGCS